MIRSTQVVNEATYVDGKTFQNRFNRLVDGLGAQVAKDMQAETDKLLNTAPPRQDFKGPFTTDKQRRYFFWKYGDDLPTKRTGKVLAWKFTWKSEGNGSGRFVLANPVPYARYVYGGFAPRTRRLRQGFHRRGGWPNASQEAPPLFAEATRIFDKRLDESAGAFRDMPYGGL
jgi:hypothetical protein